MRKHIHRMHMKAAVHKCNVLDEPHRQLKSRAAPAGMSLSTYLLAEIRRIAKKPTVDELRARLGGRRQPCPSLRWTQFACNAIMRDRRPCLGRP